MLYVNQINGFSGFMCDTDTSKLEFHGRKPT